METRVFSEEELKETGAHLLATGNSVSFRLNGYSMFPFLVPGTIAEVRKPDFDKLRSGQIIVFKHRSTWIAHRLINVENDKGWRVFTSQGDSLARPDEVIESGSILGVVVTTDLKGKRRNLLKPGLYAKLMVAASPVPQIINRIMLIAAKKLGLLPNRL